MIVFLGILLLGIGLASGLVPMRWPARQPKAVPEQAAAPTRPEPSGATKPRQTPSAPRSTVAATDSHAHALKRTNLAKAPCGNPDTSAVAVPCEATRAYQSTSPDTAPPESLKANPSGAQPVFYTAYDSIGR